jgi:hypothetical protein
VGADISRIEVDSVAGFTGFVLALCGIDFCRWIIERQVWAEHHAPPVAVDQGRAAGAADDPGLIGAKAAAALELR